MLCCSKILLTFHCPYLLQYQELIRVLITNVTTIFDIYHDTFIQQLDDSSDVDIVNPVKNLTYLSSIITTSIIKFTGILHKYKPGSNRQELPDLFLAYILVQVTYPNSQTYYYGNHQGSCFNSIQRFHESRSVKDSIEATDHETSRLTTTSVLDNIKKTIKPTAVTIY